jgi:hypothetical protein
MFSAATTTGTTATTSSSTDYTAKHLQALKAVIDEGAAAGKVRRKGPVFAELSSKNFLRIC